MIPHYLIEAWSLPESNGTLNENGLDCCIYYDALKIVDKFSNFKHNNFLPYFMGALYAKNEKCNDAIILNHHGRICDSTIANIFLIKDDFIYTPTLTEGCIAGVMRSFLIRTLKSNNSNVIEKDITVEEILNADEVFLSNSIYNMRWVKSIQSRNYSNSKIREIYHQLLQTNGNIIC
jgi:branched-chain amino acid aminotransferase